MCSEILAIRLEEVIPHLQSGRRHPPSPRRGITPSPPDMTHRFRLGDRVFIRQSFGSVLDPPWDQATIRNEFSSGLYDYLLTLRDGRYVAARDSALVPVDYKIHEDEDLSDLYASGV